MSTIGGNLVKAQSAFLHDLYFNREIISFLNQITGESVYAVPDKNEDIVINILHKESDIHGRHTDTYAYAFNIMVSAPPENCGGQLVIYSRDEVPVKKSYYIKAGSCYLIRTDLYEHEVSTLTCAATRLVVNMAYSNDETKDLLSYSSGILYS